MTAYYLHANGSMHVKHHADAGDIAEMRESDLVTEVWEPRDGRDFCKMCIEAAAMGGDHDTLLRWLEGQVKHLNPHALD